MHKPLIGFIGTGWIGQNYCNNFRERGYETVQYSKEAGFEENMDKIKDCEIVFIAVPTPFKPETGFDFSIVESVLPLIGEGKIAVIKSTILPGTTANLQEKFPNIFLFHSPEFLTEATAKYDAANPARNIVGYTKKSFTRAQEVMSVLPLAPFESIVPVKEAELVKYAGNCWFYFKVVFMNMVYDVANKLGIDYDKVIEMMAADKRIGRSHLDAVHHGGRGAGGDCFIKDMAAFNQIYEELMGNDLYGVNLLSAVQEKNKDLLLNSGKSINLVESVYGFKHGLK
jgi:nucleotide sugar dehydrogenase